MIDAVPNIDVGPRVNNSHAESKNANWVRTPADERAVDHGCWFNSEAAERVRTFFRKFLRHSKGQWAGRPFELLEWQWLEVVAPLFGWKRADGTRRGYIEVPKKNGKSTLFSGLSLYLLVGDNEPGAEIYSPAVDNWKPSKKKSTERIDGIVALIMALDRVTTQSPHTSVYDTCGILSL